MAAATTSSPKTSPQRPNTLLLVTIRRGPFVAGGDELEEQVRGFGFEGDVADLVDDEQRDSGRAWTSSACSRPAWWASARRATHSAAVANSDPVPGLAGADGEADRQVGLAGAGRAEEHHVLFARRRSPGCPGGRSVSRLRPRAWSKSNSSKRLAGREPGGADPALAAVGLAGGDLALQAGDQELLMRPGLGPGSFGQPGHRLAQGRRLQRPGQERDLGGQIPAAVLVRSSRRPSGHPALGR